jgi:6-phosphogluconolactonase (cycloisomerase 2 family)
MRFSVPFGALCFALAALPTACTTRAGIDPEGEAPDGLDYGTSSLGLTNCQPLTPLIPEVEGQPTLFSVVPPLPAGLILDAVSGVLSGTPSGAAGTSFHVITASNAVGSDTAGLTITIAAPAPPAGLGYSEPLASYDLGVAIQPNSASLAVGPASAYAFSVEPPLPAGLILDAASGAISGTPNQAQGGAPYTLRASDCLGQTTSALVWIEVLPPPSSTTQPAGFATLNVDASLSLYDLDPGTGVVQPAGYLPLPLAPRDLAASADGTQLFVLLAGGSLAGFALDGQGGARELPTSPTQVPGSSGDGDLAADPLGRCLYVSERSSDRVSALRLGALGALTTLGAPAAVIGSGSGPQQPGPLAVLPDGSALAVLCTASQRLVLFGLGVDGGLSSQVSIATGAGPTDVVAGRLSSGQQRLYVVNSLDASVSVFRADGGALSLVEVQPLPAGSLPTRAAFVERSGQRFLFVLKSATQLVAPLPVEAATGALSGPFIGFSATGVNELCFAPGGQFGALSSASEQRLMGVSVAAPDGALGQTLAGPLGCLRLRAPSIAIVPLASVYLTSRRSTHAYALSPATQSVSQYQFDPGASSLTPLVPPGIGLPAGLAGAAVARGGQFAVLSASQGFNGPDVFLYAIQSGALSPLAAAELGAASGEALFDALLAGIESSDRFAYVLRRGSPGALHGFRVGPASLGAPVVADLGADPAALWLESTGRFAYVANRGDDTLSVLRLDPWNGQPSLVSLLPVADGPRALAGDRGGCFLYVLHAPDGLVRAYRVDPQSGALALLGQSVGAQGGSKALAVDPLGRLLVVADTTQSLLRRYRFSDGSDGELPGTPVYIGATAANGRPSALAFDAQGLSLLVALEDKGEVRSFRLVGNELLPVDVDLAGNSVDGLALRSVRQ